MIPIASRLQCCVAGSQKANSSIVTKVLMREFTNTLNYEFPEIVKLRSSGEVGRNKCHCRDGVLTVSSGMSETSAPMELPLVREYFPELSEDTLVHLGRLASLVLKWNGRLNLISRKDAENLEERHLLHSLTLTKVLRPGAGAKFADIGTGGGFPGLALAIVYPECEFALIDSVVKKIKAVDAMIEELGLTNVRTLPVRAESIKEEFDYVTGRAVTALPTFLSWARPLLQPGIAGSPANGVLYFKGTLWREELKGNKVQPAEVWPLDQWVPREYFAEKFLLYFKAPIAGA